VVDIPYLGLASFLIIATIIVFYDYRLIFYLLLFTLPLSDELQIGDGLMMYMPTEPLTIGLMGIAFVYALLNRHLLRGKFWTHPLTIIVYINLIWILVTVISSSHPLVSVKYLLAKLWFVGVYFFLASHILNTYTNVRKALWLLFLSTFFGVSYVMIKHGLTGFLFDTISSSVRPFYRNHVDYGVWIAAIFPLLFLAASWYKKDSLLRLFFLGNIILTGFALFYSYTRGAWVAIFCIPIFVLIISQ